MLVNQFQCPNKGCFTKHPKLSFIITPLLIPSKSCLLNALAVFLPCQLYHFHKMMEGTSSQSFPKDFFHPSGQSCHTALENPYSLTSYPTKGYFFFSLFIPLPA